MSEITIPPQTLERLRNWQRSRVAIDGMIQATVDALQEAQGQPPGAQIDLERGVWVAPQPQEAQAEQEG